MQRTDKTMDTTRTTKDRETENKQKLRQSHT